MKKSKLHDQFLKNPEVDFTEVTFSGKLAGKAWKLEQAIEKINRARVVLFILGGLILLPTLFIISSIGFEPEFSMVLLMGAIFIVCGFLVKRYPIGSILIPLVLYVLTQVIAVVSFGSNLYRGSAWKLVIVFLLGYGLYSAIVATRIKKDLIIAANKIRLRNNIAEEG